MAWLRAGDNSATHPIVMRVAALVRRVKTTVLERDVATNEVFGFVLRCSLESAGHWQDYAISEGTALAMGGPRTDRLLHLAQKAGYITKERPAGGVVQWRLVDDPAFIHMKRRSEKEWEEQRKADNSNDALVREVRRRDGDACRYCCRVVNWDDRVGGMGGTYDHRAAGEKATVPTDLVVSCRTCNAVRGNRENAEELRPLQDAPIRPYYSRKSVEFLAKRGITVEASEPPLRPGDTIPGPARPGSDPATAGPRATGSDPATRRGTAPSAATPAAAPRPAATPGQGPRATDSDRRGDPAHGHPDDDAAPIENDTAPAGPAGRQSPGPSRTGTGRDGSGREPPAVPPPQRRSRHRRSRKSKQHRHAPTPLAAAPTQEGPPA